jgi:hypothetical protein
MDSMIVLAFVALAAAGALAGYKIMNALCDWDDAALIVMCAAVAFAIAVAGSDVAIRCAFGLSVVAAFLVQALRREAIRIR